MKNLWFRISKAQDIFHNITFEGEYPFRTEGNRDGYSRNNPYELLVRADKYGSTYINDCRSYSEHMTRAWCKKVKMAVKDSGLNCLMTGEGVQITVPSPSGKFLKVIWPPDNSGFEIRYPVPSARQIFMTLRHLVGLDVGPIRVDGIDMSIWQAMAVVTITVCNGYEDMWKGATHVVDMIQDGELNKA